ncbi:MAG: hypothetical protein IT379_35935 [Deltaproteobacteria bacterium]|nr:hypothetical protein [Deltaproteobacteria bacterium]
MTNRPLLSTIALAAAGLALSCGATLRPTETTTTWNGNGAGTPSSVTVSIASVALGDDCGGGAAARPMVMTGACADGPCGGPSCRGSSVQLALSSGSGAGASTVRIESADLFDVRTGSRVATLTPQQVRTWSQAGAYTAWDGRIGPLHSLQVSVDLSGLSWSSITEGDSSSAYDAHYRLQVVVRVDGEERTLVSADVGREPMVVT